MKYCLLILLAWNIVVFSMMGIDKWKAIHGRRRISERTLLLSAALCGSAGGWLGMEVFRHKTRHNRFRYGLPALFVLQLGAAAVLLYYFKLR